MVQLILYALFAAGLAFAGWRVWDGFTGQYIAEGAAKQLAADKLVIEQCEAVKLEAQNIAKRATDDAAAVVEASKRQSEAVEAAEKASAAAREAARKQAIAYANEKAKAEERIKKLQAAAAATPSTGQSCEALLSATNAILNEALGRK